MTDIMTIPLLLGITIERDGEQVVVELQNSELIINYRMTPLGCVALVEWVQRWAEKAGVTADARQQIGLVLAAVLEFARMITEEQMSKEKTEESN